MDDLLEYAPIAAAAFAIPQFVPQIFKLRATNDTAGVSWSWATLTSVNNGAWFAYFALSGYWAALVPASSATILAGALAAMLALRGQAKARPAVLISGWVALLFAGVTVAGRTGLGTLLTTAFILQVMPSIWTAYRTEHPTGISRGTWVLILGELSCWTIFGIHKSDPRLITLGITGITASALILARIRRTSRNGRNRSNGGVRRRLWKTLSRADRREIAEQYWREVLDMRRPLEPDERRRPRPGRLVLVRGGRIPRERKRLR